MKTWDGNTDLTSLSNIGSETARLLNAAGIRSAKELRKMGAVAAAVRIRAIRPDDPPCRSMLAGLEGAIRGVRWHTMTKEEREALWEEYQTRASRDVRTEIQAPAGCALHTDGNNR